MSTPTSASLNSASSESSRATRKPPRVAQLIATGFGLGYLPIASGTWGSLGGILFFLVLVYLPPLAGAHFVPHSEAIPWMTLVPVLLTALVGVWAADRVSKAIGRKDPGIVVIDEISGQQIAFLPALFLHWHPGVFPWGDTLDLSWQYLLAGFILFRIFDIWKPWPARDAERLPGGLGIMADDWIAGVYAAICLWGLRAAGL